LSLSVLQTIKFLFCKCCFSKNKLKSHDSKLNYLITEYTKKTLSYLDYLKMIKNYEETEILIKVVLDEHQIDSLELITKQTIEIPESFEKMNNNKFELFENNTPKLEDYQYLLNSINTLFQKSKYEKKYKRKKPIVKVNENFINLIRKI